MHPNVSSTVFLGSFCLKVAILTLDLPCSGRVRHSGDISIAGKSHKKKLHGSSKDDTEIKKVSLFTYATWNVRRLREKEEELEKTLNENKY
jgi:hypothetical protein